MCCALAGLFALLPLETKEGTRLTHAKRLLAQLPGSQLTSSSLQLVQYFTSRGLKPASWGQPGADFYELLNTLPPAPQK